MKVLTRLGALAVIGGVTVLNAGCWEVALAIALAEGGGDDAEPAPYEPDPYADPATDPYGDPYSDPYTEGAIEVRSESLSGTLGRVRGFEGNVWQESGYQYGEVATLQVDAESVEENWAVMARLTIDGGIDHPELVPGAVLTFDYDDFYRPRYDGTELYISLLGCSGQADSYWEYDVPADQVTIEVEEGSTPDHRRIQYTGTWSDGSIVQGAIEYEPL